MKLGVIGGGAVGKKHADAIRAAGDEVAYVVDVKAATGHEFAQAYDARFCESPEPLWEDPSVDAVVIAVPNFLHKTIAIDALRAGKDVLIEKPLALNRQECEQIGNVVDETARVLQVGFVHRYTGVGKEAKRLIDTGSLGEIYYAQALLCLRRGVPGLGRWFTNRQLSGGGCLIDVGVHLIDLALYLLDFPEVHDLRGQTFGNFGVRMGDYSYEEMWSGPPDLGGICDVEDAVQAWIRFANGAVLDLHVAWAGNYPNKWMPTSCVTLCGTQAGIAFELFGSEVQQTREQNGQVVDQTFPVVDSDFFLEQYLDFRNSVQSRIVRQADHRQAGRTQEIVDAIYRCSPRPLSASSAPRKVADLTEHS